MRRELQLALEQARVLPANQLPALIGELAEVNAVALSRLTSPTMESRPDELINVNEAAKRLGVSKDYLYRHHSQYKFARREGRKLLFSSAGLDAYLKKAR